MMIIWKVGWQLNMIRKSSLVNHHLTRSYSSSKHGNNGFHFGISWIDRKDVFSSINTPLFLASQLNRNIGNQFRDTSSRNGHGNEHMSMSGFRSTEQTRNHRNLWKWITELQMEIVLLMLSTGTSEQCGIASHHSSALRSSRVVHFELEDFDMLASNTILIHSMDNPSSEEVLPF